MPTGNEQLLIESPVGQTAARASQPSAIGRIPIRLRQFIKFCLVGGSGTLVDMGLLYLLADPKTLGWHIALGKLCAAEIALVNNFIWNDVWTFRRNNVSPSDNNAEVEAFSCIPQRLRRFLVFNTICGAGIVFAIILLPIFHTLLGWNLYFSNLLTITLTTIWNFGMNSRFNWRTKQTKVYII